ncbi:MAG: hypothetical protein KBS76_00490 [Ruminococcus sp.]|nr:hypothetical protein [Candidatus Apopatosoma intestinale]
MNSEKKAVENLLALDDEALREKVMMIAGAMGLRPERVSDMEKIRSLLGTLSEKDLANATDIIGKERMDEVMKKMGGT